MSIDLDNLEPRQDYFDRGCSVSYKPFSIDWRFLPEPFLVCKDTLRHSVNKIGGGMDHPSTVGKAWFQLFHRTRLSRIKQAGVLFVHVPRTAGTSISQILYGLNLPHISLSFWHKAGGPSIQRLPSFAVIRSPVARMVSAYRFIRSGGTNLMACSRYDPLGLRKLPSLETFVDALAAAPTHIRSYDVLRPQSEFIADRSGRLLVDRLFPFDDLAKPSQGIRQWLGTEFLPVLNVAQCEPAAVLHRTTLLIEKLYSNDLILYQSICGGSSKRRQIHV